MSLSLSPLQVRQLLHVKHVLLQYVRAKAAQQLQQAGYVLPVLASLLDISQEEMEAVR